MFAYCRNNPTSNTDPTGQASWGTNTVAVCDGGCGYRDVTKEIISALSQAVAYARTRRIAYENDSISIIDIYSEFKDLVNHKAPWDIKRQESWELTIGTTYPGYDVEVKFCGLIMTPEYLGNFTYGYLGYEYGIPHIVLLAGSWYAADYPMWGDSLSNEVNDWSYISMGYHFAAYDYLTD